MPKSARVPVTVFIIGRNSLQNRLLAPFLEAETGFPCSVGTPEVAGGFGSADPSGLCVDLIDCFGLDPELPWERIGRHVDSRAPHRYATLFNLEARDGVESAAMARGIRGVFLREDDPSSIARGITAVARGELWYSRKVLSEQLLFRKAARTLPEGPGEPAACPLTERERQILKDLATGASNDAIAERLCISRNTVKTHIYNIFKKIQVTNRAQALIWSIQNGD